MMIIMIKRRIIRLFAIAVLGINLVMNGNAIHALATEDNGANGNIITQINGDMVITLYKGMVIQYPIYLHGKNGAGLNLTGLIVDESGGGRKIVVYGTFAAKDNTIPGINVFYANLYRASGELIERKPVYSRDPEGNMNMELNWYLSEDTAFVVIE